METAALTPSSLEEVLPLWLNELQEADRAKGTIRRYKSAVEGFLAWYARQEQRPLTFATLTPIALVGYRNELQRTQGRATSTVNGHLSALRAWCAWLTEERYLEVNPARRIKLVGRQKASSREGLSDTQANALLRLAQVSRDAQRNYAIVQLLLQTGIRLDECSQLALDDIEFGERSGRLTVRQGKGNKARTVPLNASARQALAEYLAPRLHCDPTVKAVALAWQSAGHSLAESEERATFDLGHATDDRCVGARCLGTWLGADADECAYLAAYLRAQLPGAVSRRCGRTGHAAGAYLPRYYQDL